MNLGNLTRRVGKLEAPHDKAPFRFFVVEMDHRTTEDEACAELGIEPCAGVTFLMFLPIYTDADQHEPSRLTAGSHAITAGNVS